MKPLRLGQIILVELLRIASGDPNVSGEGVALKVHYRRLEHNASVERQLTVRDTYNQR